MQVIFSLIQTRFISAFRTSKQWVYSSSCDLKTNEGILALALVVPVALLLKHTSKNSLFYQTVNIHTVYTKMPAFPPVQIKSASTQAHEEQKSLSRWALSSAPCRSSNWFFLPLNPVFWKHCYYPPVAYCTDECLSTLSPMFLSQSLSTCWINQPFNSRSYHEAAKPHDRPFPIPAIFLLFFSNKDISTLVFVS